MDANTTGTRETTRTSEYRKLVGNRPTETAAAVRSRAEGVSRKF